MKAFENWECIGERHVNVGDLLARSAAFAQLFDQAGLAQICDFPKHTGFCIHLIRTFYLCAGHLKNSEGGPLELKTTVRNTQLTITQQTIADALGMEARVVGLPYTQGHTLTSLTGAKLLTGYACRIHCLP